MKLRTTGRGFSIIEFKDINNEECSLQTSSASGEFKVWLGITNPDPKVIVPGQGWQPIELPKGALISSRMHLSIRRLAKLTNVLLATIANSTPTIPDIGPAPTVELINLKLLGKIETLERQNELLEERIDELEESYET